MRNLLMRDSISLAGMFRYRKLIYCHSCDYFKPLRLSSVLFGASSVSNYESALTASEDQVQPDDPLLVDISEMARVLLGYQNGLEAHHQSRRKTYERKRAV